MDEHPVRSCGGLSESRAEVRPAEQGEVRPAEHGLRSSSNVQVGGAPESHHAATDGLARLVFAAEQIGLSCCVAGDPLSHSAALGRLPAMSAVRDSGEVARRKRSASCFRRSSKEVMP